MTTSEHTKEPWTVKCEMAVLDDTYTLVSELDIDVRGMDAFVALVGPGGNQTLQAHRIVDCVNACAGMEKPGEVIPRLVEALEKIERWKGEFPHTGKYHEDGSEMSYGFCYGSNGERDYMREVARQALSLVRKK